MPAREPIRLAIDGIDPVLAERIVSALSGIGDVMLVDAGDGADALIVGNSSAKQPVNGAISLTPRELEVLALLAEGSSNKLIARRLGISAHTAKFHVGSVLDKLDAVSRTDAVAQAARIGMISL